MHVQTIFVDTSWLHNVWEMFLFLLNSSFSGKMAFLRKLFAPPPFKKEGSDYAFYIRDYKGVTKETPFYMTDLLSTEQ